MRSSRLTRIGMGALAACVALASGPVRGEDKPWTLDQNNWQLGKDLLPETVLNRVKSGDYSYKVVPVDPDKFKGNYSKKFWEASEANAGKFVPERAMKRAIERLRRK